MGQSSEQLTVKLFSVVAGALGTLMVMVLTVTIGAMMQFRTGLSEIQGAMPHLIADVNRVERRLEVIDARLVEIPDIKRRLSILESFHRSGINDGNP